MNWWRRRASARSRLQNLLLFVIPFLLLVGLGLGFWHISRFVEHSRTALSFRYPLDGLEGTLLYEARLLRSGEPLYQPLQPDRFISAPYQPLSYVAFAVAESLAYRGGAPPPDVTQGPLFQPGRTVSLVAMAAAGLLLALAVWLVGGSKAVALLAGCLWFGFPPVQLWGTRIKPDPLALACTAAGLLSVVWYFKNRGPGAEERTRESTAEAEHRRRPIGLGPGFLILPALCFALAYFTKQTAVAAPLATALTLLLVGDGTQRAARRRAGSALRSFIMRRRACATFTLVYLSLIAGTWLTLHGLTAGQYTSHVWGLHQTEWWSAGLFLKYADLLLSSWPLLVLALIAVLAATPPYLRRNAPRPTPNAALLFCACYALIAVPTLLAAGAQGAHHNHLLEPYLALTLVGCSFAGLHIGHRTLQLGRMQAPSSKLQFTIVIGALCLLLVQLWTLTERPAWYGGEFDFARQERSAFIRLIQSQPGEVLADDVALLLAAGRPLRYDDPSTMGPAISSGIWDQSNLLAEVSARRFDLILLPFDASRLDRDPTGRWSPEFIATLRAHYRLLYRDVIFSFVPK